MTQLVVGGPVSSEVQKGSGLSATPEVLFAFVIDLENAESEIVAPESGMLSLVRSGPPSLKQSSRYL